MTTKKRDCFATKGIFGMWVRGNILWCFIIALVNPTKTLAQEITPFPTTETTAFVITSPSEGNIGFVEKLGNFFLGLLSYSGPFIKDRMQRRENDLDQAKLEGYTRAVRKLYDHTTDPKLKAELSKVLDDIWRLQDPKLPLEFQTKILGQIKYHLSKTINQIPVCVEELGSPRSGIVPLDNAKSCLLSEFERCMTPSVRAAVERKLESASSDSAIETITAVAEKTLG